MSTRLIGAGLLVAAGAAGAFLLLDPILAAFLAIMAVCAWVVAALASDWERHPGYQQRELARAHRRAEKREQTKEARARDHARWETHQARKAGKTGRTADPRS